MSKVKLTCQNCGSDFEVYPYRIKRGNVKFCSTSCGTTYRNKHNNPAKSLDIRAKISANHADVSGTRNPMYGRCGKNAPGYVDGRRIGENGRKLNGDTWRRVALRHKDPICEICGKIISAVVCMCTIKTKTERTMT